MDPFGSVNDQLAEPLLMSRWNKVMIMRDRGLRGIRVEWVEPAFFQLEDPVAERPEHFIKPYTLFTISKFA
jgi:hypothetical protein